LKTFNLNRGFGFISSGDAEYFFHKSEVQGRPPKDGDTLTFDIAPNAKDPSKMEAKNVTGGTAGGSTQGIVKWYHEQKGYGFVDAGEVSHFMHANDISGGTPKEGDSVWFDIVPSEKDSSKTQAKNVVGGTGYAMGSNAKGYGKGYNEMMWMMQMMQMYKGGGWGGKGYGKGKW